MTWPRIQSIALVILTGVLLFSWRSCLNERAGKEEALTMVGNRDTVLEVFVDKLGRQHSVLREREMSLSALEASSDSEITALRSDLGKALKNLQSRTVVHTITRDTVITVVHDTIRPDGVEGKRFHFTDEWALINGTLFDTTVTMDYAFRTGINLDRTWKRPKWYKRKELMLEITMLNPHATLENVQTFVVKPDPKKWWETDVAKCGASALATYLLTH